MTILRENLRTSFVFSLISLTRTWSTSLLSTNHQMCELILLRFPRHALFWFSMMPLCGVLNLRSGSSRSSISNCVRAFAQPPVIFHESVHLSTVFFGMSCRSLRWVAWIFSYATLAVACFMNFLRGLLTQTVVLVWVLLHVLLVLVLPRSTNCDPLTLGSKSSTSAILISVSQELHQSSKPVRPQIFRSVTSGPFEAQVVLRMILVFTFIDNFHDAFFQHRLARNDGVDTVCQNSFLRRGQYNSEYSPFCSNFQ